MNLKDLAKKPTLVKITIDDPEVIEEYGEPVEFYSYDRHPMSTYLKMASVNPENTDAVFEAIRDLVLDADGNPILTEEESLPSMLLLKVLNTVVESLGK